jgi:hypothetical protein
LNSFVFDPGLGSLRAGFFFSRNGFNFRAPKPAQKQAARENPAPGGGTYSQ